MKVAVVIPNWNGIDFLEKCLESLRQQTLPHKIILVDNGSVDGSIELVEKNFPEIKIIKLDKNYGFAGGVNRGIEVALEEGFEAIALLNNDAAAETDWLEKLVATMSRDNKVSIIASKVLSGNTLDTTGECYSIWGVPFPRGRGEEDRRQYDNADQRQVLAASGAASLYRAELFKDIGLFDESFFAYYEDVDISMRAQLAGWKVVYKPSARVNHHIGGTSEKLGDFRLYHMYKNFWFLYIKNMPFPLSIKYLLRFSFVFIIKMIKLLFSLRLWVFTKVLFVITIRLPEMIYKRWKIQTTKKVSYKYIDSMLYHNPPPSQPELVKITKKLGIK
ncbi:MAG: glycosyltransferase family 2 protein [Candidatus Saccharimonadales bacterium]